MRIGEVSRQSNLSIATIRYYINAGLIVPIKKNTKFLFTQSDLQTIHYITYLKGMGFSITDIHRILSLKRVSNWVEPEDLSDYSGMLVSQKKSLEDQLAGIQNKIHTIEWELHELEAFQFCSSKSGIPTKALEILTCPQCKAPLQLENAQMNYKYIMNCNLLCGCGYTAEIRNGIIYTKCGEMGPYDQPDTTRALYRDLPSELVTYLQKTYNWMYPHLSGDADSKIIMETHINSFFFLYKHFHKLNRENLYILSDKFAEIVEMYKLYIERLGIELNIIYIVNSDNAFPIREGVVDYFIDYSSSNQHELFFPSFLLHQIFPYLRDTGQVVAAYFSLDASSRSMSKLREVYPQCTPGNYKLRHFQTRAAASYRVLEQERIGVARQSGNSIAFVFHHRRDNLYIDCFHLRKKTAPH